MNEMLETVIVSIFIVTMCVGLSAILLIVATYYNMAIKDAGYSKWISTMIAICIGAFLFMTGLVVVDFFGEIIGVDDLFELRGRW